MRISARRSTEDKTGQATRARWRAQIIARWGAYCWLCVLDGKGLWRSRINLRLKWPHPRCFTRDHVIPRSRGGTNDISNQRGAHKICNELRGNREV